MMVPTACALLLLAVPPREAATPAPYTPHVVPASNEGALAARGIRVPGGLKVELFAAEPLLANPVAFWIDERGRLYVAETFRVNAGVTDTRDHMEWLDDDLAARSVEDRIALYRKYIPDAATTFTAEHERVKLIEDSDGDGKADRAGVFADGFNGIADGIGAGVLARGDHVWFACIPHLWLLRDRDGDGKADSRQPLHSGYGVHVQFYGHDLHGLRLGPDGRLYFSIGDRGLNVRTAEGGAIVLPDTGAVLRCEPDGSGLEVFATGLRNPQELAFNDAGDLFTGENNSDGGDEARWVHVVEGGDSGWRCGYQFIEAPVKRGPWNAEKLWHPRWEGQAAYIVPPVANLGDGPSGLVYYPGTGFPARYHGRFFLCDFRGVSGLSGVRSLALEKAGASYVLVDHDQPVWSVLATDCDFGPDGALYISDWVTGWDKTGKGRIYRVFDPETASSPLALQTRELLRRGMSGRDTLELTRLLAHPDLRVRQEAQFALAEKGAAALPAVSGVARDGGEKPARLHAVWALGQMARRDVSVLPAIVSLLRDRDSEVRAQAARVLGEANADVARDALVALLRDPEPRPRFFAAISLGKTARDVPLAPLTEMLRANADRDVHLRHAAVMGLAGTREPEKLAAAAQDSSAAVRMGILLAWRRLESPGLAVFLEDREPRLVLEAARAIHDVPIAAALPRLARLPLERGVEEALARRVLNANFRLGGGENAAAVARAAGAEELPEAVRVEALQELADWARPSGRDRVLGAWRPLAPRGAEAAAAALQPPLPRILAAAPNAVRAAAVETAARLSMRSAGEDLHRILASGREPGADSQGVRAAALRALESLGDARLLEAARAAAFDGEPDVRREGQRLLARLSPAEAIPALESALERGTTFERQGALAALADLREPAAGAILSRWMDSLLAGTAPAELQLDILEAAARQGSAELAEKAAKHESAKPGDDPVAEYREALAGGDARKGKVLFHEKAQVSCQRCHRAESIGGEVGPNLAGIGAREKRDYLLESLVAPNAKIARGFDTVVLATRTGEVYTGVLKEEDEARVKLLSPEGTLLTVEKDALAARAGGVSAMPEDVRKFLTKREIRDLVEYLASLK